MDVLEILHKIGYTDVKETSSQYTTRPLYRDSDNNTALAINKKTGEWYDFVQRRGGSLYKLIALTIGLKSEAEVKKFLESDGLDVEVKIQDRYELSDVKNFDKELLLKLKKDHLYWVKRGVSEETVKYFEGGVTFNGRMCNRYVFPILNTNDDLIGFSGRLLDNNPKFPKWKHLGTKSTWCYPFKWNQDILAEKREVILVESIGDMLALWDAGIKNSLVTFGVYVSSRIAELLLRLDMQKIIIAFNNDSDNNFVGNESAEEARKYLLKHFDSDQVVVAIPDYKDFGEMNQEQINLWKNQLTTRSRN